ncbi:penicillin-binding transpeptidase domain-containing protein, partial [Streptomyces sulfonofaciens]|uniref:penicillin-binding transpeptidase domain-containing protein n=1 Tax=Streptomyces sulfonofaciens TaxID=68272 RepID=UPI00227D77BB
VTGRVPDRQWKQSYWDANKDAWCKSGKKDGDYVQKIAYENCLEGNRMRAGDSVNYAIGQGDTLVTPIQEAMIYSALSNGGTLYRPTIGKAIISADGKHVQDIKPHAQARLPMTPKLNKAIDQALAGVVTQGTAAWRFGGWPQKQIPMHAKTGTAEVYGKQTTSYFSTYTKDYAVIMTISQGGTGSGASGPAVRKIYDALYGVNQDGKIDKKKALLPSPQKNLPKIDSDGSIDAPQIKPYNPHGDETAARQQAGDQQAGDEQPAVQDPGALDPGGQDQQAAEPPAGGLQPAAYQQPPDAAAGTPPLYQAGDQFADGAQDTTGSAVAGPTGDQQSDGRPYAAPPGEPVIWRRS